MKSSDIEQTVIGLETKSAVDLSHYPVNSIIGVISGDAEALRTIEELRSSGFLDTEVHPLAGRAAAEELHAHVGHSRLVNAAVRIAAWLGLADEEMEVKAQYEQALRDGDVLVLIEVPTRGRQELAARILREHRAHSVNLMGRFTITEIVPPRAASRRTFTRSGESLVPVSSLNYET